MSTHKQLLAALDEINAEGKRMTAELRQITDGLHEQTETLMTQWEKTSLDASMKMLFKANPPDSDEGQIAFTEGHRFDA
jgi:CHASE3 domain sensor protein